MILPEHQNLTRLFSNREAVYKQGEFNSCRGFRSKSIGHRYHIPSATPTLMIEDRWNAVLASLVIKPLTDSTITTKLTEPILRYFNDCALDEMDLLTGNLANGSDICWLKGCTYHRWCCQWSQDAHLRQAIYWHQAWLLFYVTKTVERCYRCRRLNQ